MDVSLQLYSLREVSDKGLPYLLELTQKGGYEGVEFAGYYNYTPAQLKDLLAKYHLKSVSSHTGLDRLRDHLADELNYTKQLGARLIVCPWTNCGSKEEILADAKVLEACAKKAAQEGITLGYHNHSHEFKKIDGRYALDILLENAPSLKLQPDVFWVTVGGVDPVSYIKPLQAAGRICSIHAKEMAKDGKTNCYVGQGVIDFKAIAALVSAADHPYVVEQEEFFGDPLVGITQSYQGLKRILSA
jgi:sugar phosphate isomerase/epimerase